ncbi:hypothetical protein [Mesorhizobium neociceri]|uniref:Uncharacterized protein n=1 Tax=Mesorhizobium neociceri TaxID=1307853 RepID=A0A838B9P9_9HYPH|nr:hypothetical protein [Mesorhizobium neociceri]MBA1142090.1 hypothetical protein [Mesorhizobium neociceri]
MSGRSPYGSAGCAHCCWGRNDWVYWQCHNMGRVDGIIGDVDLNVLKGGREKLTGLFAAP